MDPLRDRIFGLLTDLCGETDVSPDSLRLLSHTLLGVARDHAPDALFDVADALPWAVALVEASDGADPDTLADMLMSRGVIRALDSRYVMMRLRAAQTVAVGVGGQTPSTETRFSNVFRQLALLDRRLVALSLHSDQQIRDTALSEPALLAAAAAAAVSDERPDVAERFRRALHLDRHEVDTAALMLLAELETNWDGGAVRCATGFGERTRRFEISAADHLRESGFIAAVRVALLYGDGEAVDVARALRSYEVFTDDPALEALAAALADARGRVLRYVRGSDPAASLAGWVAYLRGACHELAESCEVTFREATSYAHFCLHLINFCDLAAGRARDAHDDARRAIMVAEDALKEFAIEGLREGLRDDQVDLNAWELASGRPNGEERVVERIARLAGFWADGMEAGSDGLRLTTEVLDPWYEALASLNRSVEFVQRIGPVLPTLRFRHTDFFSGMAPALAFRLFVLGTIQASPGDTVDFGEVHEWFAEPDRRRVASMMLRAMPEASLFQPQADLGFGVVHRSDHLRVCITRHDELEALVRLLGADGVPPKMKEMARDRISALSRPVQLGEPAFFSA